MGWGSLVLSTHVNCVRTAIQGVIVAAKKKSAVKKVAKKKVAKKAPAKRAVKKVAKRATKAPTKRVVKKSATKKAVAKKSTAKRTVKKLAGVKASPQRVVVSTIPMALTPVVLTPVVPTPVAPKPIAAPKQSASGRVVFLVIVGIALLAMIVWSKSGNKSDDVAKPAPSVSQSAEPTQSATAQPTETAAVVAVVEAPSKFVALKSADGLTLRWIAPMATDGLTGYNVEIRANGVGDWIIIATVPADQLTQSVTKSADTGWTQFRVTSVYSDGQSASATVFGIPGEFK